MIKPLWEAMEDEDGVVRRRNDYESSDPAVQAVREALHEYATLLTIPQVEQAAQVTVDAYRRYERDNRPDVTLRTGRHVGRTVYRKVGDDPSREDELIGIMDTRELAALVVEAVNAWVGSRCPSCDHLLEGHKNGDVL